MGTLKRKLLKLELMLKSKLHSHSYMKTYNQYLRSCGVDIQGNIKFIHSSSYIDVSYANKIHIGDNFAMSLNSVILAHDFSLECGMASIGKGDLKNEKKIVKDVYIGENVMIGAGCIVLPGTRIGNNCIIGAGTVCSGTIPDDSIIVGEKWKIMGKTTEWIKKKIESDGSLLN